ncbi:putative methyltransferase-domain-containing protein [Mycena floridula]|nr:putative methyltransferase-domain-containing protein [Mycena floridula]
MQNPNFPKDLDIKPSTSTGGLRYNPLNSHLIEAQRQNIVQYGIAGRIWEAAYIMNIYVNPFDELFDTPFLHEGPSTMIELGSGAGMVASQIIQVLKPESDLLILTDLPEVCPLLEENLKPQMLDNASMAYIAPLSWGNSAHARQIKSNILKDRHLTHIVCSDLVYFPELLAPLLRSLLELTSSPFVASSKVDQPTVIISYKVRSLAKETAFWSAFGLWFSFEPVLVRTEGSWERLGASLEGPTFVFRATRRPESFCWTVPREDQELLSGVGAASRSDETFETLLFMTLGDV